MPDEKPEWEQTYEALHRAIRARIEKGGLNASALLALAEAYAWTERPDNSHCGDGGK